MFFLIELNNKTLNVDPGYRVKKMFYLCTWKTVNKIMMKGKKLIVFLTLAIFSGLIFGTSCSDKPATTGTLSITLLDTTGTLIKSEQIFLATDLVNLKNGIYVKDGWTNEEGKIRFYDLAPSMYYFKPLHWKDFGGVQVYAGVDHFVELFVNVPYPK